jgi:hypothetical protein
MGLDLLKLTTMMSRIRSVVIIVAVALTCVTVDRSASAQTPDAQSREYQLKAAFIYNFVKFIDWPAPALSPEDDTFVVGVLASDPFGSALEVLDGKTAKGRNIQVKRFYTLEALEAEPAHVLFIGPSREDELDEILQSLSNSGVLTVGEGNAFTEAGGVIGFVNRKTKIRFVINVDAGQRCGLRMSSQLLRLAENLSGKPSTEN